MHMVLFGTLGSNGTFLNSPSASMMFLYFAGGSAPCWSNCSHKKMYIFVSLCEALLDIFGFLLAAKYGYDVEGRWDFEIEVCRV
jgi:hypothetical protein